MRFALPCHSPCASPGDADGDADSDREGDGNGDGDSDSVKYLFGTQLTQHAHARRDREREKEKKWERGERKRLTDILQQLVPMCVCLLCILIMRFYLIN